VFFQTSMKIVPVIYKRPVRSFLKKVHSYIVIFSIIPFPQESTKHY
jgi:hypothetical protein